MIRIKCPQCGKGITAPDNLAGKKGRCPGCQSVIVIEDPEVETDFEVVEDDEPEEEAPPRRASRSTAVQTKPRKKVIQEDEEDEEDDVPEAEEIDEEEEEERRPRRSKPKKRRRARGAYADCPNCGCPGHAERVFYTLWGGFIGPILLNHVRCSKCGTAYNGSSGKYNTVGIVLWITIPMAIGLVAFILVTIANLAAN